MKTTNVYIRQGTICAVTEELPKEPKKFESGDSLSYNEAAWQVYKESLQRVKDKAILIREEDQSLTFLLLRKKHTDGNLLWGPKNDTFYSLEIEVDIIDGVAHINHFQQALSKLKSEHKKEIDDYFDVARIVEDPEEKLPIEKKPEPRVFLLNKGLGDLVLNPHKPHTEWVYASDAIKEYANFKDSEVEDQEELIELIEKAMERERETAEHLHPTGFYLGLEHALEIITRIKQ